MCLLILQFCCFQPELLAEPFSTVLKKFSSSQMHDSEDVGILIAELRGAGRQKSVDFRL